MKSRTASPRAKPIMSKTKLTRQVNYPYHQQCANEIMTVVPITRSQALDDIYHCFEMCMKDEKIGNMDSRTAESMDSYEHEEGEVLEGNARHFWGNEFIFRDPYLDDGGEIFRSVDATDANGDCGVFSDGIHEFRENTHVIFKEMFFGMMWKILPKSVDTFKKGFDGCFTKNHDGIIDIMNIVNQNEQFGTILDITIEDPKYILWTSFIA